MIIAGTAIGAGMLANPTSMSGSMVCRFSRDVPLYMVLHRSGWTDAYGSQSAFS